VLRPALHAPPPPLAATPPGLTLGVAADASRRRSASSCPRRGCRHLPTIAPAFPPPRHLCVVFARVSSPRAASSGATAPWPPGSCARAGHRGKQQRSHPPLWSPHACGLRCMRIWLPTQVLELVAFMDLLETSDI
jgi:hypothetical protein